MQSGYSHASRLKGAAAAAIASIPLPNLRWGHQRGWAVLMRHWRLLRFLLPGMAILAGCADVPGWMLLQQRATITDFQHFNNAPIKHALPVVELSAQTERALHVPKLPAREALEDLLERTNTVAFLVVQQGRIVYERYFQGFRPDSLVASFSLAKSVVSALVGIAQHEGQISSVEDPVTRYLPELLAQDPRYAQVRLRHLLEMRSGIAFKDDSRMPWGDPARFYLTRDLASYVRRLRIERPADETYHYSNADTQLLAMVLERATGIPLARYVQDKLWQPMGAAADASWSLDSFEKGIPKAFCCLNATPRDYARIGLVFLNRGFFNGRQIVPADWVDQSIEVREHPGQDMVSRWNVDVPSGTFYTWQWRRQPAAGFKPMPPIHPGPNFFAQGLYGQYIFVAPEQDMVIVRLGRNSGGQDWPRLLGRLASLNPLPGKVSVASRSTTSASF
ncbi:serine hydrolase domain-containing protein [Azohydromonas lata]|uniref:Serine hydrolase n=1 Tax=Azohydromonas lata TaxID=45677 RepID=A0ABU5IKN5_9BURK|nr:serine hydrolase [Azohydromonas lata]MDZ5459458.1 serine hydrolase [Azohydromonas lata]